MYTHTTVSLKRARRLKKTRPFRSYFSKVKFGTGSWWVLSFFGGRSPAKTWLPMRGTGRKKQNQKWRFRNPGHLNARRARKTSEKNKGGGKFRGGDIPWNPSPKTALDPPHLWYVSPPPVCSRHVIFLGTDQTNPTFWGLQNWVWRAHSDSRVRSPPPPKKSHDAFSPPPPANSQEFSKSGDFHENRAWWKREEASEQMAAGGRFFCRAGGRAKSF